MWGVKTSEVPDAKPIPKLWLKCSGVIFDAMSISGLGDRLTQLANNSVSDADRPRDPSGLSPTSP